jgi:hypothetical protein
LNFLFWWHHFIFHFFMMRVSSVEYYFNWLATAMNNFDRRCFGFATLTTGCMVMTPARSVIVDEGQRKGSWHQVEKMVTCRGSGFWFFWCIVWHMLTTQSQYFDWSNGEKWLNDKVSFPPNVGGSALHTAHVMPLGKEYKLKNKF